ncbi:MAG: HipA family kinase [Bacteroidota bacterium]
MPLPALTATRYVTPLREGGSLPALVDTAPAETAPADTAPADTAPLATVRAEGLPAGLFVVKFRGAGQGARALVAELIVGQLAQHLGLAVPDLALVDLAETFGRTEPDPEIQDILKGSRGVNVGLRYLDGAFTYDAALPDVMPEGAAAVDPETAAAVVWLDALVTNIDRTARNPNLLLTQAANAARPTLWLIDHGAALYVHHAWDTANAAVLVAEKATAPFVPIRDHVLLPVAGDLAAADARLAPLLDADTIRAVLDAVPDALLMDAPEGRTPPFESAAANRAAYAAFFDARLAAPPEGSLRPFAAEAVRAQAALAEKAGDALPYRR